VKTAAKGDALERLRDEQRQIEELFETYARHLRDPGYQASEATRLAGLIFSLLRVHESLQASVLEPALMREAGSAHPALARSAARRAAVQESMERIEAMSPRDPGHAREMTTLARLTQAWFELDQAEVFALARDLARNVTLDLAALDRELASRQEALLSAGPAR
jgi:hypothetical protein